jgi:hypothetical protein
MAADERSIVADESLNANRVWALETLRILVDPFASTDGGHPASS